MAAAASVRRGVGAGVAPEPISSQLKDSFVLRSLHAWSNSPRSSILCNVAEAQDLLAHVLDDREASPLCLHLGQRPTKFVTVLGRVVGCEDREGWTRLWVDDGTAVVSVQHNHSDVMSSSTSADPPAVAEVPAPPPVQEGVPAAYRARHAPARAPPGSKRSGPPDAAERARTGAAAAERARVDVGQAVRVCGRVKRFAWGVGLVVGKNTWGKGGGGFVEVQRDPNAEAHHILACATLRLTYMQPFVLPSTVEEPTPSAIKQRAAAGPYSRTHRSLRAGSSWYQGKAERAPEAYAEAESRRREGARRRAMVLGEKLEEAGPSRPLDSCRKPARVVPEHDEEEEVERKEQKARVARAMGYDLVDAPMPSLKGKERQRDELKDVPPRSLKSSMKATPAARQHSPPRRSIARELAIERELNATSSKPDLVDLTLSSPPLASVKPERSRAASSSVSRSILPRAARSSRRANDVTPTQLASLQSAVSLSRASLRDPSSSCYVSRSRPSVMTSPSADRRLRPHTSLPDSKMSEGLFRLHVHQHIMTHFAVASAGDGSTSWTESEPDDCLAPAQAYQKRASLPAFTAAALTEDAALSDMAERVVRVLLRRKAVSATFGASTASAAPGAADGAALRARATRLFEWTLKQLVAEGTLEQLALAFESAARASASPAEKLEVQVGGGVKRRLACLDSSSRKSQRLAVSAYRLLRSDTTALS